MRTHENIRNDKNIMKVFLSYSKPDLYMVRPIYYLLKNIGFDPWMDEEDILGGQDWELEISKNIKKAHVVIIFLSSNAVNRAGYLHKEIREAMNKAELQPEGTIFIIPVKLDDCRVPTRLNTWQWIEIFKNNSIKKLVDALNNRASLLKLKNASPKSLKEHILYIKDNEYVKSDIKQKRGENLDIVGEYTAIGTNQDRSSYLCDVDITRKGDFYYVKWYIAGSVLTSTGFITKKYLTVFGDYFVTYDIKGDGTLDGVWGDVGTEKLIKNKPSFLKTSRPLGYIDLIRINNKNKMKRK